MRGMRGVGLVLVDERGRRVDVAMDVVGRAEHAVGAGQNLLVGRPRQHHEGLARIDLVAGAGNAVRTHQDQRIIRRSGMNTVPLPPLVMRSRPWSKNWPKNVIHELNGADSPRRA